MNKLAGQPKTQAMKARSPSESSFRLEKIGVRQFDLNDPYHFALTISWTQFFVGLVATYLIINLFFALLYFMAPGSVVNLPAGSLVDAFFFSIETLATVGYGNMAPVTLFSHIISAIEIFVGMLLTATMTGLVFVRFSRPKAKILFADHAMVSRSGGQAQLMIRMGNGRLHALYDASVRVTTLVSETGPDGQHFRRMVDLKLRRTDMPFFPLTWTLIHEITEDSPLAGLRHIDAPALQESGLRIMVSITTRDPSLGAQVYAAHTYAAKDMVLDMHYANAITSIGNDYSVADMGKINDMEPDTA
jgi:inward rectifier potassium channel